MERRGDERGERKRHLDYPVTSTLTFEQKSSRDGDRQ